MVPPFPAQTFAVAPTEWPLPVVAPRAVAVAFAPDPPLAPLLAVPAWPPAQKEFAVAFAWTEPLVFVALVNALAGPPDAEVPLVEVLLPPFPPCAWVLAVRDAALFETESELEAVPAAPEAPVSALPPTPAAAF